MRLRLEDGRIVECEGGVNEVVQTLVNTLDFTPVVDIAELCETCGPKIAAVINRWVASERIAQVNVPDLPDEDRFRS